MTLAITEAQAQQAEDAFRQGGAPALWEYLASQGDTYADNAHLVLTDPSSAVAALPDLQGFGNVRDLHQAMLRDTAGYLQEFCGAANDVMFEMRKVG